MTILIASQKASAASNISGASSYYPDTSPDGQGFSYAIVQVTGYNVPSADTKMKAQTSVANIYVPISMEGQTINVRVINGCHGTPRDNETWAGSTDFVINNASTSTNLAAKSTDSNGVCNGTTDIPMSFVATHVDRKGDTRRIHHLHHDGVTYNIYRFIARGRMTESGSSSRYLNAFGVWADTPGTQAGISTFPVKCDFGTYRKSCPTERFWQGDYGSFSYSTFYGPQPASQLPSYNQRIKIRTTCDVKRTGIGSGGISIYDLDAEDGSLTAQSNMEIAITKNGVRQSVQTNIGPATSLPKAGIENWRSGWGGILNFHNNNPWDGGHNNQYIDIPYPGDPMFDGVSEFDAYAQYVLQINNIDSDNAFQVLPTFPHCSSYGDWEYDHNSFNAQPGTTAENKPYPKVYSGQKVTLNGSVKNIKDAKGPSYNYAFEYRIGGNDEPWVQHSIDEKNGLSAGETSPTFTREYTVPPNKDGERICFRPGIKPFKGTRDLGTGDIENTSSGWRSVPDGVLGNLNVQCVIVGDTTNWNYRHLDYKIDKSGFVEPGTSVIASGKVKNTGEGRGPQYAYAFQRKVIAGTATTGWDTYDNSKVVNLRNGLDSGEISNNGNDFVSTPFTINSTYSGNNVTKVCFRAAISPYAGQATPTQTTTQPDGTPWRYSTEQCVEVDSNPVSCTATGVTIPVWTQGIVTRATVQNNNSSTATIHSASYVISPPPTGGTARTGSTTNLGDVSANSSRVYDSQSHAFAKDGTWKAMWTIEWSIGGGTRKTINCGADVIVTSVPIPPPTCPSYPNWPLNFQYNPVNYTLPYTGADPDYVPSEPSGWSNYGTNSIYYSSDGNTRYIAVPQEGYATGYSHPYAQYDASAGVTNVSEVNTVDDQHGDGNLIIFNDNTDNDGTVELDYTGLYNNFPFDSHKPVLTYTRRFWDVSINYRLTRTRTMVYQKSGTNWVWTTWFDSGVSAQGTSVTVTGARDTAPQTAYPPEMPPCFPRNFDAGVDAGEATLSPDVENPTQSVFSWSPTASFSLNPPKPTLKNPPKVNGLQYTVSYWIPGATPETTVAVKQFNLTGSTNMPSSVSGPTQNEVRAGLSVPINIRPGQQVCWKVSLNNQAVGTVKTDGTIISSSGTTSPTKCTTYVVDIPYTRMYGADVFAGGKFSETGEMCTTGSTARAFGNMKGNSLGALRGTGVQLALFATGQIRGVQSSALSNRDPKLLSFANTTATASYLTDYIFGGGFGSTVCAHNYFEDAASIPQVTAQGGVVDISILQSGKYHYTGPVTLTGQVTGNRRIVIYVTGRAVIRGNASGQFGYQSTTWGTSTDNIPSLYVIAGSEAAGGEIYVDQTVTSMDGAYIAQPSLTGTGGTIFSCADEASDLDLISPSPNAEILTTSCRKQLRVNGAFLAKKVHLLRTLNSLRDSAIAEPATGPQAKSAEIFQFSPELYLTGGGGLTSDTRMKIESYTALPPSL